MYGKTRRKATHIIDTASSLFQQRGYTAVGINEIIAKAETAKATFYHHFATKEHLGEAWLQAVHDRSESNREAITDSMDDPVYKIRAYFSELRRFMKEGCYRGCPYTNTAAVITPDEHALERQIVGHKGSIRKFFTHLASAVAEDKKRAKKLGDTLFLLYSGATTESQNLKATWPIDAALDAAMALCSREGVEAAVA